MALLRFLLVEQHELLVLLLRLLIGLGDPLPLLLKQVPKRGGLCLTAFRQLLRGRLASRVGTLPELGFQVGRILGGPDANPIHDGGGPPCVRP